MMNITSDDSVAQTAQATAHGVRQYAAHQLRSIYPYMKTSTAEKLLDKLEVGFKQSIPDQEPEHRQTKSRTSIFSLSAELRNTIYEMNLAVEPAQCLCLTSGKTEALHAREIGPRPALLSVSKQVRSETLSIFYSTGVFAQVHGLAGPKATPASARKLRSYLQMLGHDQAGLIKELRIFIWHGDSFAKELRKRLQRGEFNDPYAVHLLVRNYDLHDLGVPHDAWVIDGF